MSKKEQSELEPIKVYLVYTLIEFSDEVTDGHAAFRNLEDAIQNYQDEIKSCKENFTNGEEELNLDRVYEYRTEDGLGFTVGIEEFTI